MNGIYEAMKAGKLASKGSGSGYSKAEIDALLAGKVDTAENMGLSHNDYTDEEKGKLSDISNPMTMIGRVDTVEDLPESAKEGDICFVGEPGSDSLVQYVWTSKLDNAQKEEDYRSANSDLDPGTLDEVIDYCSSRGSFTDKETGAYLYWNTYQRLTTDKGYDYSTTSFFWLYGDKNAALSEIETFEMSDSVLTITFYNSAHIHFYGHQNVGLDPDEKINFHVHGLYCSNLYTAMTASNYYVNIKKIVFDFKNSIVRAWNTSGNELNLNGIMDSRFNKDNLPDCVFFNLQTNINGFDPSKTGRWRPVNNGAGSSVSRISALETRVSALEAMLSE